MAKLQHKRIWDYSHDYFFFIAWAPSLKSTLTSSSIYINREFVRLDVSRCDKFQDAEEIHQVLNYATLIADTPGVLRVYFKEPKKIPQCSSREKPYRFLKVLFLYLQ